MAAVATNGEVWLRLSISFAALRTTHTYMYNDGILFFYILIPRIHFGNCHESSRITINLNKDSPYLKIRLFKIYKIIIGEDWRTDY